MELLLDGAVHSTTLEFEGEVQYLASNWPDSVACWEFHPTLIDGTVFKPGDEMKVLMTADERRLPVFIETELIIGAAKIHLTDHQIHGKVSLRCASGLLRPRDAQFGLTKRRPLLTPF